jgi:hypothetical protein
MCKLKDVLRLKLNSEQKTTNKHHQPLKTRPRSQKTAFLDSHSKQSFTASLCEAAFFQGYENSSECVPLRTKTTKPLLPESSSV